jgi:5,6-dimethylbenzimidazole synthase
MPTPPQFDDAFRTRFRDLLVWRRDVRRFRPDPPPDGTLDRLIELACLAPSVGLSQPWRFVVVDDPDRRRAVRENFRDCNEEALAAYDEETAGRYAKLKLEGLEAAPLHLAVFADPATDTGRGVGRRTMPETVEYSVVTAIHTMWLAARAEGLGVGWISILEPARMAADLDVPSDWNFVGYFCIGYPLAEDEVPELARAGWEQRADPGTFITRR